MKDFNLSNVFRLSWKKYGFLCLGLISLYLNFDSFFNGSGSDGQNMEELDMLQANGIIVRGNSIYMSENDKLPLLSENKKDTEEVLKTAKEYQNMYSKTRDDLLSKVKIVAASEQPENQKQFNTDIFDNHDRLDASKRYFDHKHKEAKGLSQPKKYRDHIQKERVHKLVRENKPTEQEHDLKANSQRQNQEYKHKQITTITNHNQQLPKEIETTRVASTDPAKQEPLSVKKPINQIHVKKQNVVSISAKDEDMPPPPKTPSLYRPPVPPVYMAPVEEGYIPPKANETDDPKHFEPINLRWGVGGPHDLFGKVPKKKKKQIGKFTCEHWRYDSAEYTLTYNPIVTIQDTRCSYPRNETVKKIVKSNKEIVWKGCTQETEACPERPHFDVARNVRVNIPPCCRQHLLDMLKNFDNVLQRHNVTYAVVGGSIMGWYRNQQIIPYDNDIDIIMDGVYWNTVVWEEIFDELTSKHGYYYLFAEKYKVKLMYSTTNNITLDIWPYFNVKLNTRYGDYLPGDIVPFIYHTHYSGCRKDELFPPKRTTLNGIPVNIPRDPVVYLNRNYGSPDRWLDERKCTKVDESGSCDE